MEANEATRITDGREPAEIESPEVAGSIPARLAILEGKLSGAVGDWDDHIRRCSECLAYGEHLCQEGGFLADDVERVRARLELARRDIERALVSGRRVPRPVGVPV